MVSDEIKDRFLEEFEKEGIIYSACKRSGLSKATLYRLLKSDPDFKKRFKNSQKVGVENSLDVAQLSLLLLVKEKNLPAIKWLQKHLDKRYRSQPRTVKIEHSNLLVKEKLRQQYQEFEKSLGDKNKLLGELTQALLNQTDISDDEEELSV